MAAAYAFHIAENQPFVDGNKRTSLTAVLVFLDLNDFAIVDTEGRLYQAMIDLAEKRLDSRSTMRAWATYFVNWPFLPGVEPGFQY